MKLNKEQHRLVADYSEKLSLAITTAVTAKGFFSEEDMTLLTYCALTIAAMLFVFSVMILHYVKDEVPKCEGKAHIGRRKRKRKNENTERR